MAVVATLEELAAAWRSRCGIDDVERWVSSAARPSGSRDYLAPQDAPDLLLDDIRRFLATWR